MIWRGVGVVVLGSTLWLASIRSSASPSPSIEARIQNLALPETLVDQVALSGRLAVGHALFFDAGLSGDGEVACATCHRPEMYFTDGLPRAEGLAVGRRNTPTLIGAAHAPFLNWDGSADSLWSQALLPLEDESEMGGDRVALARYVARHHGHAFEDLFGELPDLEDRSRFPEHGKPVPGDPCHPAAGGWMAMTTEDQDVINEIFADIGRCLEAYIVQLEPARAAFDRYVDGDPGALSPAARRGLDVFVGEGGCTRCHNGPFLTDFGFHNLGLPSVGEPDDGHARGARRLMLSSFRSDRRLGEGDSRHMRFFHHDPARSRGAFKTPSLRNVERTGPYGHAGQFVTLQDMVRSYTRGDAVPEVGLLDPTLVVLDEAHVEDVVEFLESLTGALPDARWLGPPGEVQ